MTCTQSLMSSSQKWHYRLFSLEEKIQNIENVIRQMSQLYLWFLQVTPSKSLKNWNKYLLISQSLLIGCLSSKIYNPWQNLLREIWNFQKILETVNSFKKSPPYCPISMLILAKLCCHFPKTSPETLTWWEGGEVFTEKQIF